MSGHNAWGYAPEYRISALIPSNETYLWSTGEVTSSILIDEIGEYSVTVTSPMGCETTSSFEVIPSESAFIDLIETVDFSDPNNIIVTVSGSGNYLE